MVDRGRVAAIGLGFVLVFLRLSDASAHSGGLNAEGCHTNRKTGDYHCHRAPATSPEKLADTKRNGNNAPTESAQPVKKSSSSICHAPGSSYYQQTSRFTTYPSVEECLNSGGRLPKR